MTGIALLLCVLVGLAVPVLVIYFLCRTLYLRWIEAGSGSPIRPAAILSAGALVIVSPYLIFRTYDLYAVLSRVPAPLHASWIEYRLEWSWGIGPGGNETGFVVYRLTGGSASWAREQGSVLGNALSSCDILTWHATPVDDRDPSRGWHRHSSQERFGNTNIREYLDQYGFSIPLEAGRDADANSAIQHPGSFYRYGPGGSITVVDPRRGKVYFAYAG